MLWTTETVRYAVTRMRNMRHLGIHEQIVVNELNKRARDIAKKNGKPLKKHAKPYTFRSVYKILKKFVFSTTDVENPNWKYNKNDIQNRNLKYSWDYNEYVLNLSSRILDKNINPLESI
jgi:hypothetical protein